MRKTEQTISRLQFNYTSAKHQLGQNIEAFVLLERDGELLLEDARKGEASVQQLWEELSMAVTGKKKEVPYHFLFRAQ